MPLTGDGEYECPYTSQKYMLKDDVMTEIV